MSEVTEQDLVRQRCTELANEHLRKRPTLPPTWDDPAVSWEDTDSGWRLPLFSCPFKHCEYHTDERVEFLLHLGGTESPHRATIEDVCTPTTTPWLQRIDYVNEAIAVHERQQWLAWPSRGVCCATCLALSKMLRYSAWSASSAANSGPRSQGQSSRTSTERRGSTALGQK